MAAKSQVDPMELFQPFTPDRYPVLMFKVGTLQRMKAMREGLLYMNSASYFAAIEGEPHELRGDPDERILARIRGGSAGEEHYEITLQIGEGENIAVFDVSDSAQLTVQLPNPKNTVMFCFGAIGPDAAFLIDGRTEGEIALDDKLSSFGDSVVVVRDRQAFFDRVGAVVASHPLLYSTKYFQGGFGMVDYVDSEAGAINLGLFRKARKYEWQSEFRFVFGAKDAALNAAGAFELRIGDISDITELMPLSKFRETRFRCGTARMIGDQFVVRPR